MQYPGNRNSSTMVFMAVLLTRTPYMRAALLDASRRTVLLETVGRYMTSNRYYYKDVIGGHGGSKGGERSDPVGQLCITNRAPIAERNIHAVVRCIPAMFSEQEIKGELEQRRYTPLHIIRLERSGGTPMPLVVVILPKIEKSQQLFNEHELLGLAIRVEVQKNSRLIGQCHRCQSMSLHKLEEKMSRIHKREAYPRKHKVKV
ncbi:unnamed protein product [Acanthoscelides obtectus]|uniref:Uncharacterized protein n=1 Tax=Acanthoscelides obtectus TaxID=200917 RepID=A0A9P0LVG0_ACAOB|nr:unnamed protein product [Acanthoscelides obtectus]CAK1629915.1 hypothetical protein AOBTE_LOCUS6037 [Acanthoscelides obtectus]